MEKPNSVRAQQSYAPAGRTTDGPRILAVDDHPDSVELLRIRLKAGGMTCFGFSDAQEALEWLRENPVDVAILDVMMPKMDGYELCRRMKADPATSDIPVIFLTAKLESSEKVKGLELGGHDYLTKPVHQQELLARTRAALRVKQLQDQLKGKIALQEQVHTLHSGMLKEHWLKTLGQLATSIAHEINNPLAAAIGYVDLIRAQAQLEDDAEESLQVVDQSLERVGNKLRSLLLIADVGQEPRDVQLDRLILDLVTVVNVQAMVNKVAVKTALDAGCRLTCVRGELARALLYVMNNAIEAVHDEVHPRVWISLKKTADGSIISISDNGCGVKPEIMDRLFEPFFSTKPSHHGLGLHLAREVIQEAGGTIEVISPAGERGTTARISLPARST
jgi:C4-dicarboxylate-specific signal transduction histidine kinase